MRVAIATLFCVIATVHPAAARKPAPRPQTSAKAAQRRAPVREELAQATQPAPAPTVSRNAPVDMSNQELDDEVPGQKQRRR